MKFAHHILLPLAFALCGCDYNDFGELKTPEYEVVLPNTTIGFVTSQYKGTALNINDDIIISGYVTANDGSNNFYRTFVIQDATGAVEVKAGMYDLHNIFPDGRRVAMRVRGLVLDSYNGVPQLGLKSPDGLIGYIANRYYPGSYFCPQDEYGHVTPAVIGIGELTDSKCGLLVRIDGLTFVPGELEGQYITWAESGTTGWRIFRDADGREIIVTTSGYADFAGEQVSRGRVSLTGILMKGNAGGAWMIKLRRAGDVAE